MYALSECVGHFHKNVCKEKYMKDCKCSLLSYYLWKHWVCTEDSKLTGRRRQPLFSPALLTLVLLSSSFRLRLLIDDQLLKSNQRLQGSSSSQKSLRLGGSNFEGCISNVFFLRCEPVSPRIRTACWRRWRHWLLWGRITTPKEWLRWHNTHIQHKPTTTKKEKEKKNTWAQPSFVGAALAHNLGKGLNKIKFQIVSEKDPHWNITWF